MSPNHGCNPPKDHTNVWSNPNSWPGKIPLLVCVLVYDRNHFDDVSNDFQDFSISVKGVDLNNKSTAGVGFNAYKSLSSDIATKLSQALPVKAGWVTGSPATDEHAASCAWRLYTATIAYINALNDIPNNGAPLQPAKRPQGDGDEPADTVALLDEPVPDAVDATDLLKSFMVMDFIAAPEEPVPNT
jgi:hypothetical protein